MNINDWPDNKKMCLPDWAFGQRYPVNVADYTTESGIRYAISQQPMPDKCCIWQIVLDWNRVAGSLCSISLKLGDQLPANAAEYNALRDLFDGLGDQAVGFKQCYMGQYESQRKWDMKKLIYPQGNRLVMRINYVATAAGQTQAVVVVSTLPTEAPDWIWP